MSEHRHAPHTSKADAVLANLDDLVRSGRNGRGGEPLHDDLKAVLALVASVVRTEYAALAATPAASDGSLDVAWAAAEAALPEGTYIESVRRGWFETPVRYWVRTFRPIHGHNTETRDWPDGPTPIAALRELARLSESSSEGKTE